MAQHNLLGKTGEDIALEYLQGQGYKILHRNWRRGSYEIDIVACTEEELVIIEVKTRSNNSWSDPEDAVTTRKINHIVSATDLYIKLFDIDLPVRFGIISVIGQTPPFEIDHIEDAFYPPLNTYRR
ncbi:MAG: YraN family protein [Dysgonamonadaceae bacterium]|jgi:putative endonuclease|nr:YraN family protein [Dysgonamonadaceae bacterium]